MLKNAISFLITVELLALLLVVRKQLTYTILKTFGFIFLTEGEFNRLLFAVDPRFRRTYGQQQKNERTCIYIPHISHHVSWRLTMLLLSEIGRQLVKAPLVSAISPYLISLTHPTHARNVK